MSAENLPLPETISTTFDNIQTGMANVAIETTENGILSTSKITKQELSFLDGSRSNIQEQIDDKDPGKSTTWKNPCKYVSIFTDDTPLTWDIIKAGIDTGDSGGFLLGDRILVMSAPGFYSKQPGIYDLNADTLENQEFIIQRAYDMNTPNMNVSGFTTYVAQGTTKNGFQSYSVSFTNVFLVDTVNPILGAENDIIWSKTAGVVVDPNTTWKEPCLWISLYDPSGTDVNECIAKGFDGSISENNKPVVGDRVLVKSIIPNIANKYTGVYVVETISNESVTFTRSYDFKLGVDAKGFSVFVLYGKTIGYRSYVVQGTIGKNTALVGDLDLNWITNGVPNTDMLTPCEYASTIDATLTKLEYTDLVAGSDLAIDTFEAGDRILVKTSDIDSPLTGIYEIIQARTEEGNGFIRRTLDMPISKEFSGQTAYVKYGKLYGGKTYKIPSYENGAIKKIIIGTDDMQWNVVDIVESNNAMFSPCNYVSDITNIGVSTKNLTYNILKNNSDSHLDPKVGDRVLVKSMSTNITNKFTGIWLIKPVSGKTDEFTVERSFDAPYQLSVSGKTAYILYGDVYGGKTYKIPGTDGDNVKIGESLNWIEVVSGGGGDGGFVLEPCQYVSDISSKKSLENLTYDILTETTDSPDVTFKIGDRILVKSTIEPDVGSPKLTGIWVITSVVGKTIERAIDMPNALEVAGQIVYVLNGDLYGSKTYKIPVVATINTDNVNWSISNESNDAAIKPCQYVTDLSNISKIIEIFDFKSLSDNSEEGANFKVGDRILVKTVNNTYGQDIYTGIYIVKYIDSNNTDNSIIERSDDMPYGLEVAGQNVFVLYGTIHGNTYYTITPPNASTVIKVGINDVNWVEEKGSDINLGYWSIKQETETEDLVFNLDDHPHSVWSSLGTPDGLVKATWIAVAISKYGDKQTALMAIPNVGNGSRMYMTLDYGHSWKLKTQTGMNDYWASIDMDDSASIQIAGPKNSKGPWVTTNLGDIWTQHELINTVADWYVAVSSDGVHMSAAYSNSSNTPPSGIYVSEDSGANWIEKSASDPNNNNITMPNENWSAISMNSDGTIQTIGSSDADGHIYTSYDFWKTYILDRSLVSIKCKTVDLSSDGTVQIISSGNYVYVSINSGNKFSPTIIDTDEIFNAASVLNENNTDIYAGIAISKSGKIYNNINLKQNNPWVLYDSGAVITNCISIKQTYSDKDNIVRSAIGSLGALWYYHIHDYGTIKINGTMQFPYLTPDAVLRLDADNRLASSAITVTELDALSGILGNIQESLNNKQDSNVEELSVNPEDNSNSVAMSIFGPQTKDEHQKNIINTIEQFPNRKNIIIHGHELARLSGVTGPIQDQIDLKQNLIHDSLTVNLPPTSEITSAYGISAYDIFNSKLNAISESTNITIHGHELSQLSGVTEPIQDQIDTINNTNKYQTSGNDGTTFTNGLNLVTYADTSNDTFNVYENYLVEYSLSNTCVNLLSSNKGGLIVDLDTSVTISGLNFFEVSFTVINSKALGFGFIPEKYIGTDYLTARTSSFNLYSVYYNSHDNTAIISSLNKDISLGETNDFILNDNDVCIVRMKNGIYSFFINGILIHKSGPIIAQNMLANYKFCVFNTSQSGSSMVKINYVKSYPTLGTVPLDACVRKLQRTHYEHMPECVIITNQAGHITDSHISSDELFTLDGIVDNIQAQIDTKQLTLIGSTSNDAMLLKNKTVVTDINGKIKSSGISTTELGFLSGINVNIKNSLSTISVQLSFIDELKARVLSIENSILLNHDHTDEIESSDVFVELNNKISNIETIIETIKLEINTITNSNTLENLINEFNDFKEANKVHELVEKIEIMENFSESDKKQFELENRILILENIVDSLTIKRQ